MDVAAAGGYKDVHQLLMQYMQNQLTSADTQKVSPTVSPHAEDPSPSVDSCQNPPQSADASEKPPQSADASEKPPQQVQWNLLIRDTFVGRVFSLIRRLSCIGRFFIKSRMTSNHHCRTENISSVPCSSGSTIQHQDVGMHAIYKQSWL